jgi:TP901 family phage tail tape measure protein
LVNKANFSVHLVGTASTGQAAAGIAAVRAQVEALNESLLRTGMAADGVSANKFAQMQKDIAINSRTFRNAASSTGMWETSLVKVKSATDSYTESLEKQKLSFADWRKQRDLSKRAYAEQLKLHDMMARQLPGRVQGNRQAFDVAVPTAFNKQLDTMGNRIGWLRHEMAAWSTQMVNWGKNTQWAGRQLMVGFTIPVAAFGAATGVMAYQVDKELTRIQKVYDTTTKAIEGNAASMAAAEKELADVRAASMQTAAYAAQEYGSAATDTLAVQAELAATGLNGSKLQQATTEVMRISTLGELERQDAINATIALQSVFRMSNEQLTDSFNYMNAVENATSLQLKDFATAIPIAASPIKQFGGDIYELGVLMTAMKERGIEASQGANALKSAMQRLGRPSKIIQEEFSQITGDNITDIVEQSDNLTEILQKVGESVEGLPRADRIKVIAGLFGSWQVTRFDAMIQGLGEVEEGVGQAGAAFKIAQGNTEDWASAADKEIGRIQESVSGKFKIALETLKVEMAAMGEPFVEVATMIINAVVKIMRAFNNLPKAVKWIMLLPVAFLAVTGPLIMVIGLFANFAGNLLKFGVAATRALGNMELLNAESAVAKKAAELAAAGFTTEGTAVQNLAIQYEALAKAMAHAHNLRYNPAGSVAGGVPLITPPPPPGAPPGSTTTAGGVILTPGAQKQIADASKDTALSTEKTKRNWGGIAGSMGLATASLIAMQVAGDSVVGDFAEMAMYASLLTPALSGAWSLAKSAQWSKMGGNIKSGVAGATSKIGTGIAGWAGGIGAATGGMAKFKAVTLGIMGPVGWIATALVGIGTVAYKIWDHHRKIKEEQLSQQRAIRDSNKLWAEQLNLVRSTYAVAQPGEAGGLTTANLSNQRNVFLESGGDKIVEGYNAEGTSSIEKQTIAMKQYLDVLAMSNGNVKKAQMALEIFYFSTGMGAMEAAYAAKQLSDQLKDTGNVAQQMQYYWSENIKAAMTSTTDEAAVMGESIGRTFMDQIANPKNNNAEIRQMTGSIANELKNAWQSAFDGLAVTTKQNFAKIGVTGGKEFKKFYLVAARVNSGEITMQGAADELGIGPKGMMILESAINSYEGLSDKANKVAATEKEIVAYFVKQWNLSKDIVTLEQLRTTSAYKQFAATKKQAEAMYMVRMATLAAEVSARNILGGSERLTKETRLQELNIWRQAAGLEATDRLADGFKKNIGDASDKIKEGANNTSRLNSGLFTASQLANKISNQDFGNMFRDAMSSFQQGIADETMSRFNSQMDSAMEAVEEMGERRMEAFDSRSERLTNSLQNRQEAATNAMERRHESAQNALERRQETRRRAIERSYDSRIKKIEETIEAEEAADEARQRIFDAEMTRLERLNEGRNRNIDFNVALNLGNLDEAAKIRNDMMTQESQWSLEDADAKATRRSDKRIKRLEDTRDRVEDARDAELNRIARVEEAEKRSLERRQERQKKYLENHQERMQKALENQLDSERDALEASIDANRDAEEAKWESRQRYLEKSLQDFTNYVAYNEKDLRRHIKEWKEEHKGLSLYTQDKFEITANNINRYIKESVRDSMKAMANSIQWENNGAKIARGMIEGAFGLSIGQFKKWMLTGKFPKGGKSGGGKPGVKTGAGAGANVGANPDGGGGRKKRHTGGWVDNSPGSRKGVARTLRGNHPSEVDMTLRRGEYVVNERASAKYGGVLEAINSGRVNKYTAGNVGHPLHNDKLPKQRKHNAQPIGGAGLGFAGVMAGLMAASVKTALNQAMKVGAAEGRAKAAALAAQSVSGGLFSGAPVGSYGGRAYNAAQMRNAATIANVGRKMNMSARDIMIGIMTAITESGLINVQYGDRDSQGLFQQRPSQGWGSVAQVTDPEYAARKFFSVLKGVGDRGNMSPWMAAQTVQRSAYSNGSNYRPYWDDSQGIYKNMKRTPGGGFAGGGAFSQGPGGKHRPVAGGTVNTSRGIHGSPPALDVSVPVGTPLRAVNDGTITGSYDIPGHEPRAPHGGLGYRSYGRIITQSIPGGSALYAHLSQRNVRKGQKVKGGAIIGRTGNTGYSTGPHLHFGTGGGISPYAYLKVGGEVLYDETPAILHQGEKVLTKPLSRQLDQGIGNLVELDRIAASQIKLSDSVDKLKRDRIDKDSRGKDKGRGSGKSPTGPRPGGKGDPGSGGQDWTNSGKAKQDVRFGTYNVAWRTGLGTTTPDMRRLMGKTDVLGLQEVYRGGRSKRVMAAFRQAGWAHTPYIKDSIIGWNKDKFEALRKGNRGLNPHMTGGGRNAVNRMAAYALLRNKRGGGGKFWVVNTHLQPFPKQSKRLQAIQNHQFDNLQKMYNEFSKSAPVVMLGDFNTNLFKNPGKIPAGMKNTRSRGDRLGGTHGNKANKSLDFILASQGIQVRGNQIIREGMDSDHHAVISRLGIPGLSKGGFTLNEGIAQLHKHETVLTQPLSEKLHEGIDRFANGGETNYNFDMKFYNVDNKEEVARYTINKVRATQHKLPPSRRRVVR